MCDERWNRVVSRISSIIDNYGGFWPIPWQLAALMEEVGELSRILQEIEGIRQESRMLRDELLAMVKMEMGDVFFALACLAITLDVNLLEALGQTCQKYQNRLTS